VGVSAVLLLLATGLLGCGGDDPGPHNDQERLADRIIRGWLAGDIQPALDAVPPDYMDLLKQYMPELDDDALEEVVAQPLREALGGFEYVGAQAVELFYDTLGFPDGRCRVLYWGSLSYDREGSKTTVTRTRVDAEEHGGLVFREIDGDWYWDLPLP
ncbi:MAG: hypothetical protein ACYC55_03635, partial [Candidatus Geothermincolia bacterium]